MRSRLAAAFFLLPIAFSAKGADFFGDLSGDARYDDNVIRGLDGGKRAGDVMYHARLDGGVNLPVNDISGVTLSTQWDATQLHRFDELSSLRGSAALRYLLRPGTAFTAPWYALEIEAAGLGHKESRIRDSWLAAVNASAGRRFTDRLSGALAYRYEIRRADANSVFDTEMQTVTGSLEYQLTRDIGLYVEYQIGVGELTATAMSSRTTVAKNAYNVRVLDVAVGGALGGQTYAYQTDGLYNLLTVGGSWALHHDFSLDLSGSYYDAIGEGSLSYHAFGASLGVGYRF